MLHFAQLAGCPLRSAAVACKFFDEIVDLIFELFAETADGGCD